MNSYTHLKDNWILDAVHSDKPSENLEEQIVMDSIQSELKKNKNILNNKETDFGVELNNLQFNVPNIFEKVSPNYKNYITKSQNWIGYVIKLTDDSFTAKLEDQNNPTTYELAEFDIEDDVSEGDLELLKPGAVFYWSVGFANQNGQQIKQSFIRFKRALIMDESDFDGLMNKADELYDSINWD